MQTEPTCSHWLTYRDVCSRYRIGSSTLYRWINDKQFPSGVLVGRKSRRWPLEALESWEKEQEGAV